MKYLIENLPIPSAGVALGLVALGTLLQPFSEGLHLFCGLLSFILVCLLGAKVFMFFPVVRDDLQNSIFAGVLATCFMTCMQLATYIAPYAYYPGFALWGASVIAHLCLMAVFTKRFVLHFEVESVFPTHFIAYVGIIVASVTSPVFEMQQIGFLVFCFGFMCYAVLFVVITYRIITHKVQESAQPLFCIYAAPMSLSLAGYLATAPSPSPVVVIVMLVLAQVLYLVVLTRLPKLLRLKFYPSFAAMTFPFVITATALSKSLDFLSQDGIAVPDFLHYLVSIEIAVAVIMVSFVFVHYLRFFGRLIKKGHDTQAATENLKQR